MPSIDDSRPATDAVTVRRLRRVMAVFTGLLVGVTAPLWTPGGEFPDIPWFDAAAAIPLRLDWLFLAALVILLAMQFVRLPANRRWPRFVQAALLVTALLLLPTDQHRLQPWVWQMTVAAVVIGLSTSDRVTLACLRWFVVSIYFWSAVSKLDWAFVEGRGQWLLEGLAAAVGLSPAMWPEGTRLALAGMFPLGELAAALMLSWPRTQRVGLGLALVMHVLLLMTLGPWGKQQYPAVLVWNGYFIVQAVLLFGGAGRSPIGENDREGERGDRAKPQTWGGEAGMVRTTAAKLLTASVCLLPALSPWGYWDHWPSWAVYSERPAVVQMLVGTADVQRLPATLRPFVGPPEPLSDWRPVNLDRWSFATCWCPMYPQQRYRLAVISSLAADCHLRLRVIIKSPPNRWTGGRKVDERLVGSHSEEGENRRLTGAGGGGWGAFVHRDNSRRGFASSGRTTGRCDSPRSVNLTTGPVKTF